MRTRNTLKKKNLNDKLIEDPSLLVKCLGNISFLGNHKLTLGSLSQKRTNHRIQHTEVPRHVDKNLPKTNKRQRKWIIIITIITT